MYLKINGERFLLWRAVESEGYEIDVLLQKRKDKKSAIRFLSKLLGSYPVPKVVVSDKLTNYRKPIKHMMPNIEHRTHKVLNNRAENAHQATRRKEKCLIKFKSTQGVQRTLLLMGKIRNISSVAIGIYTKPAVIRRIQFKLSKKIWD